VNALSYTLAFNAVNSLANKETTDLFFLSLAIAVAAVLVNGVASEWEKFAARKVIYENEANTVVECRDPGIQNLFDAASFLLKITSNITIQLLSTLVARWVLTLPPDDSKPADILPTAAISLVLVWLLAKALETRQPKK